MLEVSEIIMHNFWHDFEDGNMMEKRICVIWIQPVWLYTKKNTDICEDIADGVETWFDISNYELDILFPEGKNQK